MPTTGAVLEKLDILAKSRGAMMRYSWHDDLTSIYVYGSQHVTDFISKGQWVVATFTVLLENSAAFKQALEETLVPFDATHSVSTSEYWSLGIAEIQAKVFVTSK